VDDRDGLENRCGGNSTVGSNPTPSAKIASIAHSTRDTPEIVNCDKLVETADALHSFLTQF
jgi:hypothetical protein